MRHKTSYHGTWMMKDDLVAQLDAFRLERHLTQSQLAQKLGVTFFTVNRWLRRHMKPSQIHEYQIRKLLSQPTNRTKTRRR